jgi:Tol biopolymer transport system component
MKRLLLAVSAALVLGAAPGAGGAPAPSRIVFALEGGSGPSADLTSLYTVRPDGTGLRRLTIPPTLQALGGDSGPAWGPRGRRIVFERNLPYWGSDRMRLMSVSARGGAPTRLTSGPFDAMPSVSPDGRRVAFTRVQESLVLRTAGLYTVDRAGRNLKGLVTDGIDLSSDWSPDGRTIAFSRLAGPDSPIEVATLSLANADGSGARQLGAAPLRGVSPAWSPDGRQLAFVSFVDGKRAVVRGRVLPAERRAVRRPCRRHRPHAPHSQPRRRRAPDVVARRAAGRVLERLLAAAAGPCTLADGDARDRRPRHAGRPLRRRPRPGLEPGGRTLSASG